MLLATGDAWFINLMEDSSPMFGRDWFLMRYEMLEQESLMEHFRLMEILQYFWDQEASESENVQTRMQFAMMDHALSC